LLRYFKNNVKKNSDNNWDWSKCYNILLPDTSEVQVCKRAWCAIAGVTKGKLEKVQRKVKDGHEAHAIEIGPLEVNPS
jgi:hypothetical protein